MAKTALRAAGLPIRCPHETPYAPAAFMQLPVDAAQMRLGSIDDLFAISFNA